MSFGFVAISGSRSSAEGSRSEFPYYGTIRRHPSGYGWPADGRRMAVSCTRNSIFDFKSSCGCCAVKLRVRKVTSLHCAVQFSQRRFGCAPGMRPLCARGAPACAQGAQDEPSLRSSGAQGAPDASSMRPGCAQDAPRIHPGCPGCVQHAPRMRPAYSHGCVQNVPRMRPG